MFGFLSIATNLFHFQRQSFLLIVNLYYYIYQMKFSLNNKNKKIYFYNLEVILCFIKIIQYMCDLKAMKIPIYNTSQILFQITKNKGDVII